MIVQPGFRDFFNFPLDTMTDDNWFEMPDCRTRLMMRGKGYYFHDILKEKETPSLVSGEML